MAYPSLKPGGVADIGKEKWQAEKDGGKEERVEIVGRFHGCAPYAFSGTCCVLTPCCAARCAMA